MTEPRHTKKAGFGPDTVVSIHVVTLQTRACTQGTEYVSDNDITIARQQKNRQESSIKIKIHDNYPENDYYNYFVGV